MLDRLGRLWRERLSNLSGGFFHAWDGDEVYSACWICAALGIVVCPGLRIRVGVCCLRVEHVRRTFRDMPR